MSSYRLTYEPDTSSDEARARAADITHSPDVIGNANVAGTPSNWVAALPAWEVPQSSNVKRGRSKKGTTAMVTRHGRIVRENITDDRMAHVDALVNPHAQQRMSDAEIARWATDWARGECAVCATFWEACDEHDHDEDSADYVDHCNVCVSKCDCMPSVLGGQLVAFADVIHAGEAAECAVAQRHGSLATACAGMPLAVGRAVRDNYVPSGRTDGGDVVTRDESKLAWPSRYALPMPTWRTSERSTWHGTTISAHVEHGAPVDACAYADASVTSLPSPCDVTYTNADGVVESAPYFHGHHRADARGMTASAVSKAARAERTVQVERERALMAKANDDAMAIGETRVLTINGAIVRITRNQMARYTVKRGKVDKHTRTFTLAMRAANRLANV